MFGIHLRPVQETKMNHATPVIVHGATTSIHAEIKGEDAHGARPHLNQNAIEIGAQIITMIGKIHLDPRVPHSIKMTKFHAGGQSTNIIPGAASLALDLRAQNNELMAELKQKVTQIFTAIQNLYNIDIKIEENGAVAAAKTDDEAIAIMSKAITDVLGDDNIDPPLVTPGADDFHFYTIKQPSLKATMLGLGCDLQPGLHHPHMTFNEDALMNGVNILYRAILHVYKINNK